MLTVVVIVLVRSHRDCGRPRSAALVVIVIVVMIVVAVVIGDVVVSARLFDAVFVVVVCCWWGGGGRSELDSLVLVDLLFPFHPVSPAIVILRPVHHLTHNDDDYTNDDSDETGASNPTDGSSRIRRSAVRQEGKVRGMRRASAKGRSCEGPARSCNTSHRRWSYQTLPSQRPTPDLNSIQHAPFPSIQPQAKPSTDNHLPVRRFDARPISRRRKAHRALGLNEGVSPRRR